MSIITTYVDYSLVWDRKKIVIETDKISKSLIQIRMYLKSEQKTAYKSTHFKVAQGDWNAKAKKPKDPLTARRIEDQIAELKTFENDFRLKHKRFSLSDFKTTQQPTPSQQPQQISFTAFWQQQLIKEQKTIAITTLRHRKLSFKYFSKFRPDLAFSELNKGLIDDYRHYLRSGQASGCKFNKNTEGKILKTLRTVVNKAIMHGHLEAYKNPFMGFKYPKEKPEKHALSQTELASIEALTFDKTEKTLETARDMFLFSVYCGGRYGDILKLTAKNFTQKADGLELSFTTQKTDTLIKIPLNFLFEGKAQIIAQKYIATNPDKLFKGQTNPKTNLLLKIITERANVSYSICYRSSRNTFVSICKDKNIKGEHIQYYTGHAKIEMTNSYYVFDMEQMKQDLSKHNPNGNNPNTPPNQERKGI